MSTNERPTPIVVFRGYRNWFIGCGTIFVLLCVLLVIAFFFLNGRGFFNTAAFSGGSNATATPAMVGFTGGSNPGSTPTTTSGTLAAVPTGYAGQSAEFTYVPGGDSNFGKIGHDITPPGGLTTDQCFRVWEASNQQNIPFTSLFCNWQTTSPAPSMIWSEATSMNVVGTGSTQFDLYRDFSPAAVNTGAYNVANAKHASGGLAWFVSGFNGETCVNGVCLPLNSSGAYQIPFPKDWHGHYSIKITVNSGSVRFYEGERLTSYDSWPLPSN